MHERTYRNSLFTAMAVVMVVGWPVVLVAIASGARTPGGRAVAVAVAVVGVAVYARAAMMRIVTDDDGVTVYRMLSTVRIPWADVVGVTASYVGVTFLRANGRPVVQHVISRSRRAVSTSQPGFADRVADDIEAEARARSA